MANYSILQQDFYRESGRYLTHFQMVKKWVNPNLRYLYWLRNAQKYPRRSFSGKLFRWILHRYQVKYGYQIYPETEIGPGFYLGHWGTVIINPKVKIGKNCNIAPGVTIGQQNRGKNQGVPELGDEVWIGANAVIVGGVKIGNNVLIAPNAYVNFDVPSHTVVVGNPGQITSNEKATEGYINHKV